jgi:transposase-like protein
MRKVRITPELKAQVLQELLSSKCNVSALSKLYGISYKTLLIWKAKHSKVLSCKMQSQEPVSANFVEVSLEADAPADRRNLKKAILEFQELSVSIEGIFSGQALTEIINILNKPC